MNASGTVLATLGPTTDGNVLTFFDSTGKKTLTVGNNANQSAANLTTWDGNVVIAGIGGAVFDGSGRERTGFGLSFDLTSNDFFAIDANGTSTGIGIFPNSAAGYFANDANGTSRQFGGITLDGATNLWAENDSNGHMRLFATQAPNDLVNHNGRNGNGFVIWDANGNQRAGMFALVDNTLAGFNVVDINNKDRFAAYLGTTMTVNTYDANGNVTGSLP